MYDKVKEEMRDKLKQLNSKSVSWVAIGKQLCITGEAVRQFARWDGEMKITPKRIEVINTMHTAFPIGTIKQFRTKPCK